MGMGPVPGRPSRPDPARLGSAADRMQAPDRSMDGSRVARCRATSRLGCDPKWRTRQPLQIRACADQHTGRGERIWKTGKQENRSFAGSVPVFLLSRSICSKEQMALRCIAGRRSAGAASCPAPSYLLAPCQVRLAETEHNSGKTVRHFRSHRRVYAALRILSPGAHTASTPVPSDGDRSAPRGKGCDRGPGRSVNHGTSHIMNCWGGSKRRLAGVQKETEEKTPLVGEEPDGLLKRSRHT